MFIKHNASAESATETVVELDRVEIALLFCLVRNMNPDDAIKATDKFLAAQPQGANDGR